MSNSQRSYQQSAPLDLGRGRQRLFSQSSRLLGCLQDQLFTGFIAQLDPSDVYTDPLVFAAVDWICDVGDVDLQYYTPITLMRIPYPPPPLLNLYLPLTMPLLSL